MILDMKVSKSDSTTVRLQKEVLQVAGIMVLCLLLYSCLAFVSQPKVLVISEGYSYQDSLTEWSVIQGSMVEGEVYLKGDVEWFNLSKCFLYQKSICLSKFVLIMFLTSKLIYCICVLG